jgi:hypothetical protein
LLLLLTAAAGGGQATWPMGFGHLGASRGRRVRAVGRQPLETTGQLCQIGPTQRNHGNRGCVLPRRDVRGDETIVNGVVGRYGLISSTSPSDGQWWNTMSSASDLVHYYDALLNGAGGLSGERAEIIVNDLAGSTADGADGYPQRFGIPDGLYAEPVAVKQGLDAPVDGHCRRRPAIRHGDRVAAAL